MPSRREQADGPARGAPADQGFHEQQLQKSWDFTDADGTRLGQQVTPLERVGLYVPGGKAAYPSSVLMNAVPAKVAGVRELVMASPNPNPLVLAAAALAGVDRVIGIGGAQAIGALAYGTKSIPRVDKIVGPGNAYVAEAKRQVFGEVGIDMVAGPSEILVIADGSATGRLGGDGPVLAGRARRVGAGDPAVAGRGVPGCGRGRRSAAAAGNAEAAKSSPRR